MKKLIFIILAFLTTFNNNAFSKKYLIGEWGNSIDKVIKSDHFYYYGIDLSKVRLTNMNKMLESKSIKEKYAPAWITAAHKEVKIKDIKKYHKKDNVTYKPGVVEKRFTLLSDDFVIAEDYSFPIDTVKNMIKKYELDETEGIGYVVIAENFNKPKERLYTYHVFFDIDTRELLLDNTVRFVPPIPVLLCQ